MLEKQDRTIEAILALVKKEDYPIIQPTQEKWTVVIDGRVYDSPKLIMALEWLQNNPQFQRESITIIHKAMSREFQISRAWVGVAKKKYESDRNTLEFIMARKQE